MPASGKNTNNVKRAILQNANSVDGLQRRLEAVFTRYSVAFTGERLPNAMPRKNSWRLRHVPIAWRGALCYFILKSDNMIQLPHRLMDWADGGQRLIPSKDGFRGICES